MRSVCQCIDCLGFQFAEVLLAVLLEDFFDGKSALGSDQAVAVDEFPTQLFSQKLSASRFARSGWTYKYDCVHGTKSKSNGAAVNQPDWAARL